MAKLTQQELETHLWGAANILRGKIDSADYKHYIFGLLFFKRISDVWDEEYAARLAEFGNKELAADPDEHRFNIPKGAFWQDIRKHTTNIGEHLNTAFHRIEDNNLTLKGIFQDVDFNNKERFPDTTLERLLQHFDKYSLRKNDVEADVLGNAYEYLIAQFADDAGKKGGEFYTPKMVVRLLVEILKPGENMAVYDPTCGSGGMLLETFHYLERKKKNPRSLHLYGQEMNLNTWAICKMNLFLHDIDDCRILRGDTLRDPRHKVNAESKALKTFDRVIANPPFSLKEWGYDVWSQGDPYGRDKYGCPPKSYGDFAFVQHMAASLTDRGLLGVVLPHGILFRGGAEGQIRRGFLTDDRIEAVVGLAANLFYGTGIPACLLIIGNKKPPQKRGQVLIINAQEEFVAGKNQNTLAEANVKRILKAYNGWQDEERFCRVVELAEIAENDYNLNIARYVQTAEGEPPVNVKAEYKVLEKLIYERNAAEAKMQQDLKELGYGA